MDHYTLLQQLLAPLDVYALGPGSLSGAVLAALGGELDALYAQLQQDLADAFPATAGEAALRQWELLLPPHPHAEGIDARRAALTALQSSPEAACTEGGVGRILSACGLDAAIALGTGSRLTVTLPAGSGQTERDFLRSLLPAHLGVDWA